MATRTIRAEVLDFLSTRTVKHGESVEYGWFIFQTVVENGQLDLETLDFHDMASFTRDFGPVERIDAEQSAVLAKEQVEPESCALWHAALISRSYRAGAPCAFMKRLDPLENSMSGWYIGVVDDPLDVNEPANLHFQSLYELTIHDARFAPYWLLPVGFIVEFDSEIPAVTRTEAIV
ncbi:MAG: hypothetical protein QM703_26910 [Gemmatales bacterium]